MDAEVLFCALSLVFAFACAFFLATGAYKALRRARARANFAGRASGSGSGAANVDAASGISAGAGQTTSLGVGATNIGAGNDGAWDSANQTASFRVSVSGSDTGMDGTSDWIAITGTGTDVNAGSLGAFGSGLLAHAFRNGIPAFKGVACLFMRSRAVGKFFGNVCELARARGTVTNKEAIGSVMVGAFLCVGVLASIVARNVVAGVAVDALIVMVLVLRIQAWRDALDDALRDGVPSALSTMAECFQSGYSLVQTMQMVSEQSAGKLAGVFGKCANMLQLGASSGEALGALRANAKVGELSFVAVALDVQHQTGGSIVSVLGTAEKMVQDKIDLRRSLQVQTAQARLSARVVCVMPFVLAFILSMVSEGFLTPFFSSPAGFAMLGVALVMEGGGVVMVRRMLKSAM